MRWIVDRIEESFAVLTAEDGTVFSVPLCALGGVREGDVLSVELDSAERAALLANACTLRDDLFDA